MDLSNKQKRALAVAYVYEQRYDGKPAPITELNEVFFDDDRFLRIFDTWAEAGYNKSVLLQTRRLLQALIRRGLMEEAGTAISKSGCPEYAGPGRYNPKGYTRVCKTYRLTDVGRVIGKATRQAMEEANPRLKEIRVAIDTSVGSRLSGER